MPEPLNDPWEDRYAAEVEATLKGEARRLHRELLRRIPVSPATVRVVPGVSLVSAAEPRLTDVAGNDLRFTDFVDLLLARLAEIDRGGPEQYPDLFDVVAALKVDVSDDWIFDARDTLQDRGLIKSLRVFGRTAPSKLTGDGRLYIERGGDSGIINEYKQHPTSFVFVTGAQSQVAVGNIGDVRQTSVRGPVPDEAWQLLEQVKSALQSDEGLTEEERQNALGDVETARAQLERPEPNKQAARALLDPLAKIASIATFVTKLGELLA